MRIYILNCVVSIINYSLYTHYIASYSLLLIWMLQNHVVYCSLYSSYNKKINVQIYLILIIKMTRMKQNLKFFCLKIYIMKHKEYNKRNKNLKKSILNSSKVDLKKEAIFINFQTWPAPHIQEINSFCFYIRIQLIFLP